MPAISLARVVLPPPLGPVMTVNFPSGTEKLTSRTTWLPPGAVQEMCCSSSIVMRRSFLPSAWALNSRLRQLAALVLIKKLAHVRGGCTPGNSRQWQLASLVLIKKLAHVRAVGG